MRRTLWGAAVGTRRRATGFEEAVFERFLLLPLERAVLLRFFEAGGGIETGAGGAGVEDGTGAVVGWLLRIKRRAHRGRISKTP